ncbi:MAG: carboxypeptidase regulatory-like domain-containing protein, partial [Anaerolineales bacterium]|nr:carboxypeptidase regulatory-like domain-containing protein [Anaerolineales bacterium]
MNSFHRIALVAVLAVGLLLNLVLLSPLVQVTAETTEGDFVYVALPYANAVGVVDMEAQSLVETISFGNTCYFPWQLALDPLGEQLYVACKDGDSVVVVETATNTVVSEIEGIEDASGIAFTRDGAWALVGSRDQNQIVVVDTAVMTVTETIYTPGYTRNLVPHPYFDQIFATSGNGQILIIDTNQMDIVQEIDTSGTDPWDVAVSADGLWLFTGDRWGAGLDVIDLASGLIHDTVTGVGSVTSLAVNPNGQEIYALSNNQVKVVDADSLSVSGAISGFSTSWGLAMACGGEQLYVSQTSGAVSAIDLGLKTVDGAVSLNGATTRGLTACPEPVISDLFVYPAAQAMSAARGEQVDYELRLTNATNVTDTFTLVSGGAEWATSLSVPTNTVGPLAHGESVTFTVAVTVPVDAAWYLTDTAVITATSVSSPTFTTVAQVTTEAYAPPAMSLNPQQFTATVEVDSTLTQTLVISNGNGVPLAYEIQVFGEGGTSFAAASKTQYGYGIPNTVLNVYGLEDNTAVTITDLETGEVLLEKPDLNRLETLDAYPNTVSNRPFKVESNQPVLSRQTISEYFKEAMAFVPSESGTPSGNRFVFLHYPGTSDYYVFAPTGAHIAIKDGNDNVVAERTMSAGSYWPVQLAKAAMYQLEADSPVLLQSISQKGFTTVPAVGGAGSGTAFYFAASEAHGALAVFAYETADVAVYSLDTDELLWSETIEAGDYWWQLAIPAGPFYLTSTAVVEVWAGATLDSVHTNIEHLGDDISFAGGRDDRDYYVHSLGGGSVIFAPYAGTFLDIDGEAHYLQKDDFMLLEGCCAYRHIRASQPIVVQTLGKASTMSYWTNVGAYLGGTTEYGDDTLTWLSVAPLTGTAATNSHETAVLYFNAYQLQPGDYRAQLQVINNEPPSFRTAVPVTMTVVPAANMGLVTGSVSDYRSDEPLEAVITAVGQPYTITTNADGSYEFWLEEGTHTLTVQAPGYETTTREVSVVAQQTTTEDFALIQSVSFLILEPDTLAASQAVNQQTTQAITLTNDGPIPFTYELREIAGTFTPTMGLTPFASPNDGGPDEFGYIYRDSDDADGPYYRWIDISETGTELVAWAPWEDTALGPVPLGFAFPYYGEQYEQFYVSSNGYVSFGQAYIDPVYNPLPDVNNPNNMIVLFGHRIYGLFDQQGESDTRIYYQMLSNPQRAVVQFENPRDRYGQNLLGGAAQMVLYPNGNILMQYELESASNRVVGIENATGQIGLNYPHGVKGDLAICFVYPGNAANCDAGDVPWLSTEPVSGTVSAFSAETVGVTLDATGLQPGLYTAVVQVANDAHNGQLTSIPVTMEVLPTGTMGHVTGAISDLWSGDPVAGDVWVDGWYTDTAVYTYTFWADAGTHQLTVSAPGHMTQTTDITVVAGTTITQDIELEHAQARLENLPDTLTMTLPTGISATQTFTLANTGPLSLQYAWHEIDPVDPILPSKPTDATNAIKGLRIL